MAINWNFPAPRPGLAGALDKFIGPGATRAELALQFGLPALAAIAAPLYASHVVGSWSWLQYAVCCILAFDTAGGIITNATSSAKRWYHRAGQGFKQHFGMVSLHLLHLVVVSWLFLAFDVRWLLVSGGYLLVAAAVVLWVPQYLQRPVALVVFSCALLISLYALQQPVGLEWFLPLFYLKLLVSHLPKEEPYRPTSETDTCKPNRAGRVGELIDGFVKAIRAKDINGVMSVFVPEVVSFDLGPPLQHGGGEAFVERWQELFESYQNPIDYEVRDLSITAGDDVAFSYSLNRMSGTRKNGQKSDRWLRWSACYRKTNGKWLIVHEHVSVPVDLGSGKAMLDLKP